MKLYIAGPMTGYENFNWPAFDAAAAEWRADGHEVINPAEMDRERGLDPNRPFTKADWHIAMRHDIEVILTCDALVVLPGWEKSRGANVEVTVARALGLPVYESMTGQVVDIEAILAGAA